MNQAGSLLGALEKVAIKSESIMMKSFGRLYFFDNYDSFYLADGSRRRYTMLAILMASL